MPTPIHVPVLLDQVLRLLRVGPGARVIDATVDGGGHAAAILERSAPNGRLLGLDRDPDLAAAAAERFGSEIGAGRATIVHASFRRLRGTALAHGFDQVDAVLFDLGLSSHHFDRSGRGFSFARDEPLDLRFDPVDPSATSAADVLAGSSAAELAALFRDYGEERYAARIARAIAASPQPIRRTGELFEIIRANLPGREQQHAGRSAARIFQALRIAANDELGAVREALPQAFELLAPGGRLAVIAFQSLEDRLVKQLFSALQREGRAEILTKRPLRPSDQEVAANSRSASAKLRVAERSLEGHVDEAAVERVLRYWVGEDFSAAGCSARQDLWFRQSAITDNYVRERFSDLWSQAVHGGLAAWAAAPRGRLALITLLDQFGRNLCRGSADAFAGDEEALRLSLDGIETGMVESLRPLERALFGLPLQHSERPEVQEQSVRYFTALVAQVGDELAPVYGEFLTAARQHRDVIARFGRFPHRNAALARRSTPEEIAFLEGR